jgi:4-guanidinobutyraldehyde dehydrogenase/NAD-dependent aldehyde dehydrogenase
MSEQTLAYWQKKAETLTIEGRAFINGCYVDAANKQTFDCISPIDSRKLADVAYCEQADADIAVNAARVAFNSGVWSKAAPTKRKAILLAFADLIELHSEELALLETLDMGKPIADSLAVDLKGTVRSIRWSAEAIDKIYDEIAPTPDNQLGLITHEPCGVVTAIVPWNFPLQMASWKLGPALAAGNSVILKPSEKSPLTAIKLASLAKKAGIPDGVLNVLPGLGHIIGKALALHMDVDTLVFTGSTAVAKQLMIYAGESNLKRVWSEAGGKSPNIVFADAPNLDHAARAAAGAFCFNQGEVCTAGTRLLVEESIKDEFIAKVVNAVKTWVPGNPLDPKTNVGAIVDKIQYDRILGYIARGKEQGAKVSTGGQCATPVENGYYIKPTVFSEVDNAMDIAQHEIFGSVLSVITFTGEEQAITIANDTPYGLAAGIWTSNFSRAHKMAKAIRAGSVWVNQWDGGDMTAPFGGFKQSGNGRDKSHHAFSKYTEIKATWMKL